MWCVCVACVCVACVCVFLNMFTVSICVLYQYLPESGHTVATWFDPFIKIPNPLLHKVTGCSVRVPYGTPPGAHKWDGQCTKVPRSNTGGGGGLCCCTQTLSLRTRTQFLPLAGNWCHLPAAALWTSNNTDFLVIKYIQIKKIHEDRWRGRKQFHVFF